MVKGNPKSSASSATRKKHLKKHAAADEPPPKEKKPKVKGERGKKKAEPKVKMYIPPVKPAPVQPDPLETTGLAHTLPSDLLVVLRNISKKAQVTKTRALEELQMAWVNQCLKEGPESILAYTLVEMLPVWLHHVSALFVNASRRVRLLAVSVHSSLLQISPVREQIVFFLRETAQLDQLETILGAWCLVMHDVDRTVATTASKSWNEIITTDTSRQSPSSHYLVLSDSIRSSLNAFIQKVILDPNGVYLYLNPLPPTPAPAPVASTKKASGKATSTPNSRKDDGDQTPRSKQDEQEESEQDRGARLRIGALGAARWMLALSPTLSEDLQAFYSNAALWTILYPQQSCSWIDIESFGFAQPNVRKSGWGLTQTLLAFKNDQLENLIPTLSTAILRSAWIEMDSNVQGAMWGPLLVFLKHYPQCWTIDENKKISEADDESGSEPDSDVDTVPPKESAASSSRQRPSEAYLEFLQFLRLGCSGSPVQGYPAVVVIISTIPPSILMSTSDPMSSPLSQFFGAFWEAVGSRALSSLHRVTASAAFLSSLLESVVFLVKRIRGTSMDENPNILVQEQFSLVWEHLSSQKLKVGERAAARLLAQTLEALVEVDQGLFNAAWDVLVSGMKTSGTQGQNVQLVSAVLKVFYDRFKKSPLLTQRTQILMKDILEDNLTRCDKALSEPDPAGHEDHNAEFGLLVRMLDQFRDRLFLDETFSSRLDAMLSQHAYHILTVSSPLLLAYLLHQNNEAKTLEVWHSLLATIATNSAVGQTHDQTSIGSLLAAAQKGQLPKYLVPRAGELDAVVGGLLEQALSGPLGSNEILLVQQILVSASYFVSNSGLNTFLQIIIATFASSIKHVIHNQVVLEPTIDTAVTLIQAVFPRISTDFSLLGSLLPDIFLFAYLLPHLGNGGGDIILSSSQSDARALWTKWLEVAPQDQKIEVLDILKAKLKDIIQDTSSTLIPEDVFDMVSEKPPGLQLDLLSDLFPGAGELDSTLTALPSDAIDPSLALLDPLIPPASISKLQVSHNSKVTDYRGFSSYARIVSGILHVLTEERQLAKKNLWALRHFFALSIYAQDLLNVPSASSKSPVFDETVTSAALLRIVGKTKQLSVYLLNSAEGKDDSACRRVVLDRSLTESVSKDQKEGLNQLQTLLFNAISYAKQADTTREARILKLVMEPLLADGIDVAEADLWIQLGRKLERTAPQASMAIISLATSTGAEPPRLDRYRNEVAANLLGVKPNKANTEGLLGLRKLAACAPDPEGEVAFLPPPRAVNVVKACQGWVLAEGDDEDELDEEVQSAMLPIFTHLAPILQNIPGSHWPFIFDVVEAVLESSSDEDDEVEDNERDMNAYGSNLVGLARALRFVIVLEDLAKRNKSLMAEWSERRLGVLTAIRDLKVITHDPSAPSSTPRSACRELVLSIVQNLPPSLIDHNTLSKMCHLIDDFSPMVQKMAYQLLKAAARKRTEYFVIEAGVDIDSTVQITLPPELLDVVTRQMHFGDSGVVEEDAGESTQNIFGYLLGWLLVFDLFQDASFKVKSSYIEQLRNLNIVMEHFIPCFLSLLRLNQGSLSKAFKLDIWAVDQFYVDLYEPGNPHTIPVLAAHVYYRALLSVPSLIHSWILDCKDRQLTNTITAYTSTHFSPVLIRTELEHVRSHAISDGLADDSMSVKVAAAINEVVAAYTVDEHQLEIKLRIPGDWPLHKIEVRDVKRVGVDENRWRAWVLGVQQTIWSHNGRIVDGLGIFKKNVTLHFEGQVECAICYSIISVMDGTLPKKPCKTCKNRFHSGCLYKWFNSSHSSSCPLCRSDII